MFYFFSSYYISEIWHVLYTYSTSQLGLDVFQVNNSQMWLLATVLGNIGLEDHKPVKERYISQY